MSDRPAPATRPLAVARAAAGLLRRRAGAAYLASAVLTAANTVPDVLRQVLVWSDPSAARALLVDVVGVLTATVVQVWLAGVLAGLPGGAGLRWRGSLARGGGLAVAAVRAAPGAVATGVVLGGSVSAVVTLPASVAALGFDQVLGPLRSPSVGAFTVATVSDALATWLTLPFLALVLVLVAGARGRTPGRPGDDRA